jgi:hypothetical protein
MEHTAVYNTSAWRDLPRDYCAVRLLLDEAAGPCRGLIHHHHVDPTDPDSRPVQVCAAHHPKVHMILRSLSTVRVRHCTHNHRYDHARRECEARLNAA